MNLCSFAIEKRVNLPLVAGIDEAGRGCLAGPVVAAVVVFPESFRQKLPDALDFVKDSKLLSASQRKELKSAIEESALSFGIGLVDAQEIDRINILQATFQAARSALAQAEAKLGTAVDYALIDGNLIIPKLGRSQEAVIKGDQFSKSIAAASILAKVTRDDWMIERSRDFPNYEFEKHKGYGTEVHRAAILQWGPSPLHRQSFLKKISSKAAGARAESTVEQYLVSRNFKILERNWRCRVGEIDLIAERGHEIHLIEVRSRSSSAELGALFPAAKQSKLRLLAEVFVASHPQYASRPIHLDLMKVQEEKIEPLWDALA